MNLRCIYTHAYAYLYPRVCTFDNQKKKPTTVVAVTTIADKTAIVAFIKRHVVLVTTILDLHASARV